MDNLEPAVVFINNKFINVETINTWECHYENNTMIIAFLSGEVEGIKFDTTFQLSEADRKLDNAMERVMYG